MSLLIWLLVAVTLLIGLLAIPLELQFRLALGDHAEKSMNLVWAFGLARVSLLTRKSAREPGDAKPSANKSDKGRKASRGTTRRVLRVLSDEALRARILRYFGSIWRAIDKRDLRLRARIGLGDPADTGQLWAIAGPVAAALSSVRDASVNIQPEFTEEIIDMDTSGRVKAVPLTLIGLTLWLLMSPTLLYRFLRR